MAAMDEPIKRWVVAFALPAGGGGGMELAADTKEQAIEAVRAKYPNVVSISALPSSTLFGGAAGGRGAGAAPQR
jgi:tRNA G37 N-methylase TrmD